MCTIRPEADSNLTGPPRKFLVALSGTDPASPAPVSAPRPPRVPRLLVHLLLPLAPRGGRAPLEVLLLFVAVLLVLASVELRRGGGPPFLLLHRGGGRLPVVATVAVLCSGGGAFLGRRRVRGGFVGGGPAAALGVGGVGLAGEADAREDAGLGLGPRVGRLLGLRLVPRRGRRRGREWKVVVAIEGALLAGAGGAARVPIGAGRRRRRTLRSVRLRP
jgi:hypothetical protein